jgi:hypothetical protein
MRIRGGHTIEVYRSTGRDRYGDGEEQLIGTIDHVLFQWGSSTSLDEAEETSYLSTVVYCPRDAAIRLQARDRFKFDGETYVVVGDRKWDENHPVTGHNFGYYTSQVMAMS